MIVIEEIVEPLRFEPAVVLERLVARFFEASRDENAGFAQLGRPGADLVVRALQQYPGVLQGLALRARWSIACLPA